MSVLKKLFKEGIYDFYPDFYLKIVRPEKDKHLRQEAGCRQWWVTKNFRPVMRKRTIRPE
jgi:hypothetical protein